jgi:tetratricopeptide (TPR) repeat protein
MTRIRSFPAGAALVACAVALAFATPARAYDAAAVAAAKTALQTAVNHGKSEEILAARARFDALSVTDPDAALLHYWVAVADWRVTPIFLGEGKDKAQAKKWCEEGIARCDKALKLDPKMGEALALKCGLQGLSLQYDPGKMMTLGMGMESGMNRAQELSPKNPRVTLLDAISTLYKPAFVGGGADKALVKFEKAQALFAAETVTDPAAPDWGKDDVYVWSGRAASQGGDLKAAQAFYQKALAVNPENGWVKYSLLPGVEKKLAAKS